MAYVTLLYGGDKYLDGVLITGLGLRKQRTKFELICLITKDCIKYTNIIKLIYDKVLVVPYITPNKKFYDDILINNNIYEERFIDTCTKFNIFNKDILNYEKIIFIDSDLIPIKNFDSLFSYNTPAGWLEYKIQNDIKWGEHNIKPNTIIPKEKLNLTLNKNTSINGGLLIIKPDKLVYNELIMLLKNKNKFNNKFLGMYNVKNKKFQKNMYMSEQEILSTYFNKWYYISGLFNAWGPNQMNVNGIHMAGLSYKFKGNRYYYKTWNIQFNKENAYNFHTNLTLIYGLLKYPQLKKIILNNFYLIINDVKIKFNKLNDENKLTHSQILLYSLFN